MDYTEDLVTETVGSDVYAYYPLGEYIVRAPGVCGGRPTFKYTRIEVASVLELLSAGDTTDQIVAGYRGRISERAIEEALHLAQDGLLITHSISERV